jgi:hypothetical protein
MVWLGVGCAVSLHKVALSPIEGYFGGTFQPAAHGGAFATSLTAGLAVLWRRYVNFNITYTHDRRPKRSWKDEEEVCSANSVVPFEGQDKRCFA